MSSPHNKRTAIVIGIDNYFKEANLRALQGAESDAEQVYERLISTETDFNYYIPAPPKNEEKDPPGQYLIGKNATYRNITKAISSVFREENNYELVLFYFAGHGLIDRANQRGYIAAYDIGNDPFVCGISMGELKSALFNENSKANVIILLDCCYAGKIVDDSSTRGQITQQDFENQMGTAATAQSGEKDAAKDYGRSKLMMVSCEKDETAREHDCRISECSSKQPHRHGLFTSALLKALDGGDEEIKTVDDNGYVSYDRLQNYIAKKMWLNREQFPIFGDPQYFLRSEVRIAAAPKIYKETVETSKNEIQKFLNGADNILNIIDAANKIHSLVEGYPNSKDIQRSCQQFTERTNEAAMQYKGDLWNWIIKVRPLISRPIDEICPGMWQDTICRIVRAIDFDWLAKGKGNEKEVLLILDDEYTRYKKDESNLIINNKANREEINFLVHGIQRALNPDAKPFTHKVARSESEYKIAGSYG
jgi:Caspase domain